MTDEHFLSRWSRLRSEAADAGRRKAPPPVAVPHAPPKPPPSELPPEPDPELPSPSDLDGASDYRPFLRENVPLELRREALRRAWTSDAAISDFRGMADYDWDFNAPGYGLPSSADLAEKARDVLRAMNPPEPSAERDEDRPSRQATAESDGDGSSSAGPPELADDPSPPPTAVDDLRATCGGSDPLKSAAPEPPRRRHGGALPG